MENDIARILERVGLRPNEAAVYLACLQENDGLLGHEVARATGMGRTTVDRVVERLLRRGFLSARPYGRRKAFAAVPPEQLLYRVEESARDLREAIPLLRMGSNVETRVRFYEGRERVAEVFDDILVTLRVLPEEKRELLAVSVSDVFAFLPNLQKDFIDKRVRERIPIRWLVGDGPAARERLETSGRELRQMRLFDSEKFPMRVDLDVYGRKVALLSMGERPSALIIEDQAVADSFRSMFELMWLAGSRPDEV